jgi:hypothetical protein
MQNSPINLEIIIPNVLVEFLENVHTKGVVKSCPVNFIELENSSISEHSSGRGILKSENVEMNKSVNKF